MSAGDERSRVVPPGVEEIARCAELDGIELAAGEADELLPVVAALTDFADLLDRLDGELPLPAPEPRDPGYVPSSDENPHNAFIRRCHVEGSGSGPLAGLTVGLKDNISLAGIPTTNGSRMTSSTPVHDAVAVERILAAGGTIVGKLNMDDFGASGLGETSAFGAPRNPVDPTRSAGGSSGGSGAAVRAGEVDLSLGVDQGGSGRIPAAFCGVVAVKPTHGLVPSWGIIHIDHTIDFVTPIARTVEGAALLLGVIAGHDWRDAQWVRSEPESGDFTGARHGGRRGLAHRGDHGEHPRAHLRAGRARQRVAGRRCPPRRRRRGRRGLDSTLVRRPLDLSAVYRSPLQRGLPQPGPGDRAPRGL